MRIGIDIGSTDVDMVALAQDNSTIMHERVPITTARYEDVLDTLRSLVGLAEHQAGRAQSVGISLAGAVSAKTGRLKNSNNPALAGADLVADIRRALARDVNIGNDANCFTLSEAMDGAAAGLHVVLGVLLGTGVGAGMVIHRKVWPGANAIVGEWGHNSLPWSNDEESARVRCYCGKCGCIEQFLSIPGLQRAYKARAGVFLGPQELVRAANSQDVNALETLNDYTDRLARSLAAVINVLDPHAIVLGGPLASVLKNYRALHELVARYTFTDRLDTKIVPSQYGDVSTVRGAAMLVA